ncbi:MAG: CPBP family intramembrane glutamic endopeptidase [Candidatus Thorarchaeota archaeon]|jgi:membrane protease YdiL (CAAX protease family)
MSGGNEEFYSTSNRFTISDQNAVMFWIAITVGLVLFATLLGASLAGNFTSFPFWVTIPLLVMIPLIIYLIPQKQAEPIGLGWKTTLVVPVWFFSMSLLVAQLGFFFSTPIIALLIFVLGFAVPRYYLRHAKGFSSQSLGFTLGTKRNVITTVVLTIVYGLMVWFQLGFWEWMGFITLVDFAPSVDPFGLLPIALLFGFVVMLMAAALPEELIFRTVLQSYFSGRWGRWMGILNASLIFGLAHMLTNIALYQSYLGTYALTFEVFSYALAHSFIFQAQIGLILGVAWERTRSLLLPVMLHAMHNAVELLPYFLGLMLGFFF